MAKQVSVASVIRTTRIQDSLLQPGNWEVCLRGIYRASEERADVASVF